MFDATARPGFRRSHRPRAARWFAAAALAVSLDAFALGMGGGTDLYDAGSGKLPSESPWSWTYVTSDDRIGVGMDGGRTFLDSTGSSAAAGYSLFGAATLDSAAGFRLDFSLRIDAETHASPDRSGFSLIVLDKDKHGVELSFWTDAVWAKHADSAFSHAESIAVDTRSVERSYSLTFSGSSYALATDGAEPLNGTLRNYLPAANALGGIAPLVYGQSNYIFFGDNTGSAAARVELGMINLAPVPEPGEWALMLTGLGCVAAAIRRRGTRRASP